MKCTLTTNTGMCNQATPVDMFVAVDHLKDCGISAASRQLTIHLENASASDPDDINLTIGDYASPGGHIPISHPGTINVTDVAGTATNDSRPDPVNGCPSSCAVNVQETSPAGTRHVSVDVSCGQLCVANGCLKCTDPKGGPVRFKVEADCP